MAGLVRRWPRRQRQPVERRRLECRFSLWIDPYGAARPRISPRAPRVRVGCSAGVSGFSENECSLWRRLESVRIQMDVGHEAHRGSLFRNWRRYALHQHQSSGGHVPREFHEQRRAGLALPAREAQYQRGGPLHAHFERGPCVAESGNQYDPIPAGFWRFQPEGVAANILRWANEMKMIAIFAAVIAVLVAA